MIIALSLVRPRCGVAAVRRGGARGDHSEELEGRVSALEARVDAEEQSVKEHFAEMQRFITFSLTRQTNELRKEIGRVERTVEALDRKLDGHRLILLDILSRLPLKSV
jgi:predicted RNase H-like nuclease (RuvC/YqgF family)